MSKDKPKSLGQIVKKCYEVSGADYVSSADYVRDCYKNRDMLIRKTQEERMKGKGAVDQENPKKQMAQVNQVTQLAEKCQNIDHFKWENKILKGEIKDNKRSIERLQAELSKRGD